MLDGVPIESSNDAKENFRRRLDVVSNYKLKEFLSPTERTSGES